MTTAGHEVETRRSSGLFWFWTPVVLILFLGGAFAVAASMHQPDLTPAEALAAGYGGLAALIVGLLAAALGLVIGLFGALLGLLAAGGVTALTLFIVASPVIAIVLFVLLMRRPKSVADCPDPGAH